MILQKLAYILAGSIAGIAVGACSGCANLDATKVPLQARVQGCDHGKEYDGFRYYLSRPHIVVSERVELGGSHQLTRLSVLSVPGRKDIQDVLVLEPLMEQDQRYWNFESGELLDAAWYQEQGYTIKTFFAPKQTAPSEVPKGNGGTAGALQAAFRQQGIATSILGMDSFDEGGGTPVEVKPEAFQVVHLPDFEEQMRIKHKNCLAYSKFDLHFADGWQLREAGGSFDSTEVAARVLQSLSNAISAAAEVQSASLRKLPASPAGGPSAADLLNNAKERGEVVILIKESQYVPPGVYRLQKSWEMGNDALGPHGMLTSIGLPVQNETTFHIIQ